MNLVLSKFSMIAKERATAYTYQIKTRNIKTFIVGENNEKWLEVSTGIYGSQLYQTKLFIDLKTKMVNHAECSCPVGFFVNMERLWLSF